MGREKNLRESEKARKRESEKARKRESEKARKRERINSPCGDSDKILEKSFKEETMHVLIAGI